MYHPRSVLLVCSWLPSSRTPEVPPNNFQSFPLSCAGDYTPPGHPKPLHVLCDSLNTSLIKSIAEIGQVMELLVLAFNLVFHQSRLFEHGFSLDGFLGNHSLWEGVLPVGLRTYWVAEVTQSFTLLLSKYLHIFKIIKFCLLNVTFVKSVFCQEIRCLAIINMMVL